MSISTNLVTLSVHDSYTFEGVEIAINPDIFFKGTSSSLAPSAQHTRNPSYASTCTVAPAFGSSASSVVVAPSHPHSGAGAGGHVEYHKLTMCNTAATTTVNNNSHGPNHMDDGPATFVKSVDSSSTSTGGGTGIDQHRISAMFQPGDIIEIKVWDKRTHIHAATQDSSSFQQQQQHRSGASSHTPHRRGGSIATVSTSTSGSTRIQKNTNPHDSILTRAVSKLAQQQQSSASSISSVFHPLSDPNIKGHNTKSSTSTAVVAAAAASTSKPPIVPRNTSNATTSTSAGVSPKLISSSPKTPPKATYFSFKKAATTNSSEDATTTHHEDFLDVSTHTYPLPNVPLLPPATKRSLDASFSEEEEQEDGKEVGDESSHYRNIGGGRMGVDVSLSSSVASSSQVPIPTTGADVKDSSFGNGKNLDDGSNAATTAGAAGLTTANSIDNDSMDVSEVKSLRMESGGAGGGGLHSRMSSLGSPGSHVATVVCDDDFLLQQQQLWRNDPLEEIAKTHTLRLSFVTSITAKSLIALKPGGRTKISMLKKVADLYELSTYDMVTITKFSKDEEARVQASCQADFVTVSNVGVHTV
jgi:hypothetical protein